MATFFFIIFVTSAYQYEQGKIECAHNKYEYYCILSQGKEYCKITIKDYCKRFKFGDVSYTREIN